MTDQEHQAPQADTSQGAERITEAQSERASIIKALVGGTKGDVPDGQGLMAQMQSVSGEAPPDAPSMPIASAPAPPPAAAPEAES